MAPNGVGAGMEVGRMARAVPVELPAMVAQVLDVQKQVSELGQLATQLENAVQRLKSEPQDAAASGGNLAGNAPVPVMSLENRLSALYGNLNLELQRIRAVVDRLDRAV